MLAPETRSPLANLLFDLRGGRAYHAGELQDAAQVGIRALDARTLCMELEKPAPYFLQLLVNFVVAPQHCLAAHGAAWCRPGRIVASGPFLLDSWSGGELRLLPNPVYHGARSGNIQEVRLALLPDPETLLQRYEQSELDVLDLRFFPAALLEQSVRQHVDEYISLPSGSLSFLGFDTRQPPFQDERLRRAFVLAVDKELLANVIQRGVVFPAGGGLLPPGLPGHQPAIGLPYDPRQARDLFAQAGFSRPGSFPGIEALTPLASGDPVSQFLAQQWRECLGVEVSWRTFSPGLHLALDADPSPLFLAHWHADYPDPDDFLGASQFLRWSGWREPAYLHLLEASRSTNDPARRMSAFREADRLMMAQAPIAPLTYNRQHFLLKPWVRRYPTSALYSWFWKDALIAPH
jgi:oligopeptide transport system substrate-binding protein